MGEHHLDAFVLQLLHQVSNHLSPLLAAAQDRRKVGLPSQRGGLLAERDLVPAVGGDPGALHPGRPTPRDEDVLLYRSRGQLGLTLAVDARVHQAGDRLEHHNVVEAALVAGDAVPDVCGLPACAFSRILGSAMKALAIATMSARSSASISSA